MAEANAPLEAFKTVIATEEVPLLGPRQRSGTLSVTDLDRKLAEYFVSAKISTHLQPLLRSAALLWHDHLDASHTISQSIETREGSWLHGIMHRREPDYGNAKYWFRRVGQHEAFPRLAKRAADLMREHGDSLFDSGQWDAFAFIDECEQAERSGDTEIISVLRQIQAAEFDVLVAHILAH